uniref:Aminotransferase-like plant mobile domain-containing protein n=1 Tax=Cajanus cajan TaxID=3821 RepID=A0A151UFU2_CAJCA
MHSKWVETGISEFIQLAKFDLYFFDPQMLFSAIFFWNRETRAFEFPCGFVCPTLFDIAAFTGLAPIGDRFYPDLFEEGISIKETSISWDMKTYLAFITAHMGQMNTPVSTSEHIAFLMYWLSACVFCTTSLQVPKYYYILAQALHLGKKICLSKLLLASLYTCLDEASESLLCELGPRNLSGPLWLLQLWLSAIFEKKLSLTSPFTPACELEGARLTTLTPRKCSIDNFAKYIDVILSFTDFSEDLAPFIRTTLTGPSWLRKNNQVGSITRDSIEMWFGFLSWDIIISGMRQKDVRIYPYQPQLFSRQFGLCQMKPLLLRRKESIDVDICVEIRNYEEVLEFILRPEKELKLTPCNFSPFFLVSKCYLRWWCQYYVDKILNFDDFLKKLINSPLSSQGPKQSDTYKNQTIIYQFEQFFKVCYRPDNIGRTIFDASISLSKMVQRNIRAKKVINPQGKTDFEKFCPKNIPPLPNALFGLVKHLSHPPWVKTLDPFYLERKEIPVKNRVTCARCSVYDFP